MRFWWRCLQVPTYNVVAQHAQERLTTQPEGDACSTFEIAVEIMMASLDNTTVFEVRVETEIGCSEYRAHLCV
jgi:hypothetical protein